MAVLDDIKNRLSFHIRDLSISSDDLDQIIYQVMEDIANDTRIFKKMYGFSVHKDIAKYNFRALANLNERLEAELQAVSVGDFRQDDILEFLSDNTVWPNPEVTKTEFTESAKSRFIGLMDIYDEYGRSVIDKFENHGTTDWFVYDEIWLGNWDGRNFAFTAYVVPSLDEIREEDLSIVMGGIIEGAKYYIANSLQGPTDSQVANLYYQRYYAIKRELMNRFPTMVYSKQNRTKDRTWL